MAVSRGKNEQYDKRAFLNHLRLADSECLALFLFSVQDYP